MSLPPLDYSYRGLSCIDDLRATRPRNLQTYKRSASGRFWASTLRLNNNNIIHIAGIAEIVNQIFEVPENLTWLDLSFNQLRKITNELSELYNVKILYLHGNKLSDFATVLPVLSTLPKLYSLTLHGNPLEEKRNYRLRVLSVLPRLRNLDFTNVTNSDLESLESARSRENSGRL